MNIVAMIPARYSASRFPGKLMKDLGGKPVILQTYEATKKTNLFKDVYVVTSSNVIFDVISNAQGKVIRSKKEHNCGSDRIAEAAEFMDVDLIINVQGDEPFIDENSLKKLIVVFNQDTDKKIDLASLMVPMTKIEEIENPNNVKVITDTHDFAIYFSRNVIPHQRDETEKVQYYKHKGIYAFRKEALIEFYHTEMTPIEKAEKIECIRYLEMGKKIKMIETITESIGIDTPEDLEEAKKMI